MTKSLSATMRPTTDDSITIRILPSKDYDYIITAIMHKNRMLEFRVQTDALLPIDIDKPETIKLAVTAAIMGIFDIMGNKMEDWKIITRQ